MDEKGELMIGILGRRAGSFNRIPSEMFGIAIIFGALSLCRRYPL